MMDLSQTYMRESDRIDSLFTYKMSLVPTNGQVLLRVLQAETGNSLLAQSTLLEISLAELGFVTLDVLFYIFRKIGVRFLKIHTDNESKSEMDWIKDVIPATQKHWEEGRLSYILPILTIHKQTFVLEWKEKLDLFKKEIWLGYDQDQMCRDFLAGKLTKQEYSMFH
jgi:hypothetical protein